MFMKHGIAAAEQVPHLCVVGLVAEDLGGHVTIAASLSSQLVPARAAASLPGAMTQVLLSIKCLHMQQASAVQCRLQQGALAQPLMRIQRSHCMSDAVMQRGSFA